MGIGRTWDWHGRPHCRLVFHSIGRVADQYKQQQTICFRRGPQTIHRTTRRRWRSWVRLVCIFLAVLSATFGFWIACNTAGFNFWTVVLGYGILSLIGTYAFGGPLRDAGSFLMVTLTDKLERDWWIEVVGLPGVKGFITGIHILWIELEYFDVEAQDYVEVYVPTSTVLMNVVRRSFHAERTQQQRPRVSPCRCRRLVDLFGDSRALFKKKMKRGAFDHQENGVGHPVRLKVAFKMKDPLRSRPLLLFVSSSSFLAKVNDAPQDATL